MVPTALCIVAINTLPVAMSQLRGLWKTLLVVLPGWILLLPFYRVAYFFVPWKNAVMAETALWHLQAGTLFVLLGGVQILALVDQRCMGLWEGKPVVSRNTVGETPHS